MQEATFLILTALADGTQHGYGIIADVQQISGGRVRLRAGTLYTALDRLRADGLIGVDREEVVEGAAPLLPAHPRRNRAAGRRGGKAAGQCQGRADAAEAAGGGHMSDSSPLERGYRRVLACYPKAFRRESEDEILAVLLATAHEGQRRVGVAESADLIMGAVRMHLSMSRSPRRPRSGGHDLMNRRLTLTAAAATVLASVSLYSLITTLSWFWAGVGAVIVAAAVGALTRLRTLPVIVCLLASLAGLVLYLNALFAGPESLYRLIPTPASVHHLILLAERANSETSKFAPRSRRNRASSCWPRPGSGSSPSPPTCSRCGCAGLRWPASRCSSSSACR